MSRKRTGQGVYLIIHTSGDRDRIKITEACRLEQNKLNGWEVLSGPHHVPSRQLITLRLEAAQRLGIVPRASQVRTVKEPHHRIEGRAMIQMMADIDARKLEAKLVYGKMRGPREFE